jgi:Family of unknown function (DUF5819)
MRIRYRLLYISIGLIGISLHFLLLLTYVISINPISFALNVFNTYVYGDFFRQGWAFFSPNPETFDYSVTIKCYSDTQAVSDQINISEGIYKNVHRSFLSPHEMIRRIWEFAPLAYFEDEETNQNEEVNQQVTQQKNDDQRERILNRLRRLTSIASNDICPEGTNRLSAGLWALRIPVWTNRYAPKTTRRLLIDLKNFPIDSKAGHFGIWQKK